eukprot:Nitzschia sp. Nitz4//scaffold12_size214221//174246//174797//NITZ4_001526-RA/size214221-processed-gene-0.315-mRNA-1//1//CDS//3329535098//394//frame0
MTLRISGMEPEASTIKDVLLCWESGVDEDDVTSVDFASNRALQAPDIVPPSPNVQLHMPTAPQRLTLEELKEKYRSFIPDRLPAKPLKRTRPNCLFISYFGTRTTPVCPIPQATQPTPMTKKAPFEPSPNPTDAPMLPYRPKKRPRTMSSGSSPIPTQGKDIVSAMPSLGPTGNAVARFPLHM